MSTACQTSLRGRKGPAAAPSEDMNALDRTTASRFAASCILFLLPVVVTGCAFLKGKEQPPAAESVPPEPPKPKQAPVSELTARSNRTGKPYQVNGKTYHPLLNARGYEEKGIASWYGPSCHGRQTSCGEVFDMYKPSAAHKLLPMHTRIKVTNLENGKSVSLTVNDRGPFIPGRVLDLSYAAAKKLAMVDKGLARILIRTSGPVEGQKGDDLKGDFFIHVGSFDIESDARILIEDMKSLRYRQSSLKVVRSDKAGAVCWRVEVGPYKSMSDADKAYASVAKDYPSAFIVGKE